jgi:hypothetical protein
MIDDIRELLDRDPFRTFTITGTTGDQYVVHSPKQVTIPLHGEPVHYLSRDGETAILPVRHIVRVTFREGPR